MKAPYSPDSLQNTLNGKEQFSFNISKRREINLYTFRHKKISTCCGKGRKFLCKRNFLNFLLIPPWLLLDGMLNQVSCWLLAVRHCLFPHSSAENSDLQIGHITSKSRNKRKSAQCYALGLLFTVSYTFLFCFVFKSHLEYNEPCSLT